MPQRSMLCRCVRFLESPNKCNYHAHLVEVVRKYKQEAWFDCGGHRSKTNV